MFIQVWLKELQGQKVCELMILLSMYIHTFMYLFVHFLMKVLFVCFVLFCLFGCFCVYFVIFCLFINYDLSTY